MLISENEVGAALFSSINLRSNQMELIVNYFKKTHQIIKSEHYQTNLNYTLEKFEISNYDHTLRNKSLLMNYLWEQVSNKIINKIKVICNKGNYAMVIVEINEQNVAKIYKIEL